MSASGPLFAVTQTDENFYNERLRDFLPDRMIDIHTHVWKEQSRVLSGDTRKKTVSWPARVAKDNQIEDLMETYELMFPGKKVTPLIFSTLSEEYDDLNAYVSECSRKYDVPALIFSVPQWSGEEFERRVLDGGFIGAKSYLTAADPGIPVKEVTILDFFPHHQLEIMNKHKWIMMLHVPRDLRLRDPMNLKQLLEIESNYPDIQLIVAHVGRAYCNEDVGDAFKVLSETENMKFDISANTNSWVFERLIEAVGPRRILFGSDMPVLRMRMRRICENGIYVNVVAKGAYGDVSEDIHMREIEGADADRLTFFMYEEIDAFRGAAERAGLTSSDIEDVFYNNASNIIDSVTKETNHG